MMETTLNLLVTLFGFYLVFKIKRSTSYKIKLGFIYLIVFCTTLFDNSINNSYGLIHPIICLLFTLLLHKEFSSYMTVTDYHKFILTQELDNLPSLVWIKDIDNRYTFINDQAVTSMFPNAKKKEVIGKTDEQILTFLAKQYKDNYSFSHCEHNTKKSNFYMKYGYINNKYKALKMYSVPMYVNHDGVKVLTGVIYIGDDVTKDCLEHKEIINYFELSQFSLAHDAFLNHIRKNNVSV